MSSSLDAKSAASIASQSDCSTAPSPAGVECRGLDTPERVCFYEQDFYVLSNFSSFAIMWELSPREGLGRFDTSEHLYHWLKFSGRASPGRVPTADQHTVARAIRIAPSAHEAFKIAERHRSHRRRDWDEIKVGVMKDIIRAKAEQHEYVRRKLLATGDRELVENSWRDDFWGWGPNCDGQNMLGKLWMEVRAELRGEPSPAENPASSPSEASAGNAGLDEPLPPTGDRQALADRLEERAQEVLDFVFKKEGAPGLVSIPRSADDVDALLCEAAAQLRAQEAALQGPQGHD